MLKKYGKRINWLLVIGIIATILFVFSNYFFGKYQMSFTNLMYDSSPWNSLQVSTEGPQLSDVIDSFTTSMYTTIKDGSILGAWDPQVALGAPADLSSWMYPLNYLYLLPLGAATMIRAIAEFLIAFIGMYLLMKTFGCKKPVAAIAGVSYCFSSVIVMWLGWQHSDVAAFAPLAFFFFEKFLNTIKIKYCLGLTVIVYLMLVAGMPTYAAYFMYLLAAYVLFRTAWIYHSRKKKIFQIYGCTLGAVALAVLGSIPYLMNLMATVGSNGYAESRAGSASHLLDLDYLQTLFMPYLRVNTKLHMNESTIYVGLLVLVLLPFTAIHFKRKKRLLFWTIALASVFLLIFTPALDIIFTHMPLVNTSHKFRLITLLNFCLVIIAGLNLNDIVVNREEYCRHKIRTCLTGFIGMLILGAGFLWTYSVYDGQGYRKEFIEYIIMACCIGGVLLIFFARKVHSNIILAILCMITVVNMGAFVKRYLPWVEKDVEAIPPATDTIQYLQENTENERVAVTGLWTLFPNTYLYYGLEDVRAHNFVLTNSDMATYYNQMTEGGFHTKTRFAIINEANTDLLKYLGVKYFVQDINYYKNCQPLINLNRLSAVSQEITFADDCPEAIVIKVGTYQQEYQKGDICTVEFRDSNTDEVVYSNDYDMTEFKDNSSYVMKLPSNYLKGGQKYIMTLSTNTSEDRSVALYVYETEGEKVVSIGDQIYNYEIAVKELYDIVYYGNDGLIVDAFGDYSDRVELADTVMVGTEEEILDNMSEKFEKHTAFYTEEEAEKLSTDSYEPLTDSEYAEIAKRSDDSVTVNVHTESAKILMLNEYYDSDWNVYVNGEKRELLKSNYLFRSVEVPTGDSTVEFRYEPKLLYAMYVVSGISWSAIVVLAVCSRKIQRKLERTKKEKINQIG